MPVSHHCYTSTCHGIFFQTSGECGDVHPSRCFAHHKANNNLKRFDKERVNQNY